MPNASLPKKITKEIANLRIHVERANNRMKTYRMKMYRMKMYRMKMYRMKMYRILKSVLPITILHCIDEIARSCTALSNLKDLLIRCDLFYITGNHYTFNL